ncbi:hypothetical protein H072_9763 [Dactylellina haptotyla CBS 200.50]|uniref:Mid2 domain-containing protein n=1 Tax=Dactylellina haptotyla (strain CBS 200.50) TaxID=1284197 RepID=S8BN59_DACHA|nr:hypothetical protein H072_9763 [Dactylellina haptotyla CBS 200.50]
MPRTTHLSALLSLILLGLTLAEDLTEIIPTLTSFGSLAPFTPPSDCFTGSVWTTIRDLNGAPQSSTPLTRYFTRWYVGCNIDEDTGEYNTCCPPNYNTWGFYVPGDCPGGYTSLLTAAANPWVGTQRGTVCCPSIISPSGKTWEFAGFATSYINPIDRSPISISCFRWDDFVTSSGTVFEANWNARAIIVFGTQLTSVTFDFAQFTGAPSTAPPESSPTSTPETSVESTSEQSSHSSTSNNRNTSPSPGSTTSSGARQTESGSTTSSTTTSGNPDKTAEPNASGGKKSLGGGAIAGIVIGVSIPIIGIAIFIAYKIGRRKQEIPTVPIYNDPKAAENGETGGIWSGYNGSRR